METKTTTLFHWGHMAADGRIAHEFDQVPDKPPKCPRLVEANPCEIPESGEYLKLGQRICREPKP